MDPTVLLTVFAVAALAATLTLAVWRTLKNPSSGAKFEDSLAMITGTEAFEGDTSLMKSSGKKSQTWSGYWADAFEKSGREVADPAAPGRMVLGIVLVSLFFGVAVFPGGVYGVAVPAVAVGVVHFWLGRAKGQRLARLEKQLPLLLSSLRTQMQAGMTVQGAVLAVAGDLPAPLGDEMRQVRDDVSVSIPLEVALDSLAKRSPSRLMHFLVSSMGIAIRSGSDLIPQLIVIEETVRQRARIQGKLRSAIATAKPTAYIAMGAPILLGGWMFISDPSFGKFYFGPDGFILLLVAGLLFAAGVFTVLVMISNVEKV